MWTNDKLIRSSQAIAVDDGLRVDGGQARARREDANEVQGVDGAQADDIAPFLRTAHPPQGVDGLRTGLLLAVEAGDKAAAPHEAARLQAAQRPQHVAPGQR